MTRTAVQTRSLRLLLVYAWCLCAPALHLIAHAETPAPNETDVVATTLCDGPCQDPEHAHEPGGHDDRCTMCKVARSDTVVAGGAGVTVTIGSFVLASNTVPACVGDALRGSLGARAPPAVS